jgi:hypothetical protein
MALTNNAGLTTLPPELYPIIFTYLESGQLCILGCVNKAMADIALIATGKIVDKKLIGKVTIPKYLREKLKWEILCTALSRMFKDRKKRRYR